MLGDGDAGEVEEGDGEDDEGEQPAEGARVWHLGESIWRTSKLKNIKVEKASGEHVKVENGLCFIFA